MTRTHSGTISGDVQLRPVRVGLVVGEVTTSSVRKAAGLASAVWGGAYFPILTPPMDMARMSEGLSVDVLHPLDPSSASVCESPGFRWTGRTPYGPFDASPDPGFHNGLLPIDRLTPTDGSDRWDLFWEHDELAALYDVWLGVPPTVDSSPSGQVPLPFDSDWNENRPLDSSPIATTAQGVIYNGESLGIAVVVVGDDPEDLVRLWNLRAMGATVHPWVRARPRESAKVLTEWLGRLETAETARTWRSGDGSRSGKLAHVSTGQYEKETEELKEVLESRDYEPFFYDPLGPGGWRGSHPLGTQYERSFSAHVDRDTWQVELSLPSLPLTGPPSIWPGIVAAHISVHRETRTPQDRSLTVPAIRGLSDVLSSLTPDLERFMRATGDGQAISVQGAAESITVPLAPTIRLFEYLFREVGEVGQSNVGRFETELVNRLGGTQSAAANEPAVRQVLGDLSNALRARPIARLIGIAERDRGSWPGSLSRMEARKYAESVVYRLASSRLILPALNVRCPTCTSEIDVRPKDLANEMHCDVCLSAINLGLALALERDSRPWGYKLAAGLSQQQIRSGLATMAVFTVLSSSYRAGSTPVMPHVFGLTVSTGEWECEIDIAAALADGPLTVALVGEIKGGTESIDQVDIDNLTRIQTHFRRLELETLLVFGTTRPDFDPTEVSALREVCEAAPTRLRGRPSTSEPALPIVLCGEDVSKPWFEGDHPWRWGGPGGHPLSGLAEESCRRNLGLEQIELARSDPGGWNLSWSTRGVGK